jgi:hypothetical protein
VLPTSPGFGAATAKVDDRSAVLSATAMITGNFKDFFILSPSFIIGTAFKWKITQYLNDNVDYIVLGVLLFQSENLIGL